MLPTLVEAAAIVGVILSTPLIYRILSFLWLYVFRPPTVQRYLHNPSTYALVTGASNGIGKAIAQELCCRGFNLILHGRNKENICTAAEEISAQSDSTHGQRTVRHFLADASLQEHDFSRMVEPFKDLHIAIVTHNVGGSVFRRERIDDFSQGELLSTIHQNAIFPLLLTRALLSQLHTATQNGPVMVQVVGSLAADISSPYFSLYSSGKRFLQALARGLDADERVFDRHGHVQFVYLDLGVVQSNSMRVPETLLSPSAKQFARSLVDKIGCGWKRWATEIGGDWMVDRIYGTGSIVDTLSDRDKKSA